MNIVFGHFRAGPAVAVCRSTRMYKCGKSILYKDRKMWLIKPDIHGFV